MTDNPAEPVIYRVTEPDIVAGNNLWRRHKIKSQTLVLLILLIYAIGLGALAATGMLDWSSALLIAPIVLVGMAAAIVVSKFRSQRTALKYFRESRQEEISISWTETHLCLKQTDAYQNRLWADFKSWAEDDDVLALFLVGPLFVPVPKRVLTAERLQDMRACLDRAGVSRAALFPI